MKENEFTPKMLAELERICSENYRPRVSLEEWIRGRDAELAALRKVAEAAEQYIQFVERLWGEDHSWESTPIEANVRNALKAWRELEGKENEK